MGTAAMALTAEFVATLMLLSAFFVGSPPLHLADANRGAEQLAEAQRSLMRTASTADSSAQAPSKRWGAMMVWDVADQYVLLFGGSNGASDTWSFIGGNWTELYPSAVPSNRVYGGIAYDPLLNAVVLFGGRHPNVVNGVSQASELNDTWTYAHGVWTNITSSVGRAPPGRESMGLTYDSADGYLLLFGGAHYLNPNGGFLNDTWALEGRKWVEISTVTSPPIRYALAMVFDAADGYVLLYGGVGQVSTGQPYYNDTWSYRAGVWTNITTLPAPTGRVWTMITYYGSGSSGYVMVFGGQANHQKTPTTAQDTTYRFDAGVWKNITLAYTPGTRFGAGIAYDPVDGYTVLFGGLNATTVVAHTLDDTWAYSAGVWTNITSGVNVTPHPTSGWSTLDWLALGVGVGGAAVVALVLGLRGRRRSTPPQTTERTSSE